MNVSVFGNGQRPKNTLSLRTMQDVDDLISRNLRRLMLARNMKQNELAQRLEVSPAVINDTLAGRRQAGKSMLQRLCTALDVDVWEFYITADTPVIADPGEREALKRYRIIQRLGGAESVAKYEMYLIQEAQQEAEQQRSVKKSGVRHPVPIDFSPEEREALRLFEKADRLGVAHLLIDKAHQLLEKAEKAYPGRVLPAKNPKSGLGG